MNTFRFFLISSFILLLIPFTQATDLKRQELPSEKVAQPTPGIEEKMEEPEEEPISGEKKAPAGIKNFYKEHFDVVLGLYEEWDSNIFLDEDDEVDDFLTLFNPDMIARFAGEGTYLEAQWIGRYGYYADNDEFIASNSISGMAFFTPTELMALGLRGSYDRTEDSNVTTFFGDRILQLGYDIVTVQPGFKMRVVENLVADFSYNFDKIDVRDSGLDDEVDRQGQGLSAILEYEVIERTYLLGGYSFRDVEYEESSLKNSFSNLVSVGVRRKIPSLFNIDLRLIYDDKDFDNSPDGENIDVAGGITTTFSRYTTLIFNGYYGLQESSRGEFTQYVSSRFSLTLQHYLTSKVVLTLRGGYEIQSFDERDILVSSLSGDQDTTLYNISSGLRRTMLDWLSLEVIYTYQERDTDFEDEDLQDHVVHIGAKIYI